MNKTELDYLKDRIDKAKKCIKGDINSRLNAKLSTEDYTIEEKIALIRKGKAVLLEDTYLMTSNFRSDVAYRTVVTSFTYPKRAEFTKAKKVNDVLRAMAKDAEEVLEVDAAALIDKAYLGLIQNVDIPNALKELTRIPEMMEG